MSVEGYDLVMLGILAAAAVLGYFKGIVWQLAWIAGIAASSYVAFRFAPVAAPFFGQQAPWNRLAAMLALYAGTSIVVWLVFRVISGAINAIHLSAFDHQLGLLLGLAKGAMLCVVVTFFAVTLAPAYRDQIVASRSGRIVAELIVRADTYLPKEIQDNVAPYVKQFEEKFQGVGGNAGGFIARPQSGQSLPGLGPQSSTGQQSPLQAMWEGVTSAAAWTGTEQGGQGGYPARQAGGTLPPGSTWFAPQAEPSRGLRGGPPAASPPARSTGSAFASPPAPFQPPPQQFPIGSQSPLPPR